MDLQRNGDAHEPLFGRCVLVALVNLLPHRQVIIGASVLIGAEGRAGDVVEHQEAELQADRDASDEGAVKETAQRWRRTNIYDTVVNVQLSS